MNFNFLDSEEETDEEETLDLSDLSVSEEPSEEARVVNVPRLRNSKSDAGEEAEEVQGFSFSLSNEEPELFSFVDVYEGLDPSPVSQKVGTVSKAGEFSFEVEDDIPQAKKLTSPEVKARAKRGRKRGPAKMDFEGKKALGWSLFCAHKDHLPNLCEREMSNGNQEPCSCPCHEERGYVRPEPESVSGSDDEEYISLID